MSGSILKGATALNLSSIDWFSAVHLEGIMLLNALDRLPQTPRLTVPVIRE